MESPTKKRNNPGGDEPSHPGLPGEIDPSYKVFSPESLVKYFQTGNPASSMPFFGMVKTREPFGKVGKSDLPLCQCWYRQVIAAALHSFVSSMVVFGSPERW